MIPTARPTNERHSHAICEQRPAWPTETLISLGTPMNVNPGFFAGRKGAVDPLIGKFGFEAVGLGELIIGHFEHGALHAAPVVAGWRHVVVMGPAESRRDRGVGNLDEGRLVAE